MRTRRLRILTVSLVALLIPVTVEMTLRIVAARPIWLDLIRSETNEMVNAEAALRWNDDGPQDYASAVLNVVNGERVTLGQPAHAAHDLYMFGSSTLFGYYSTDAGTLPSQLQKLTSAYRVRNLGTIGVGIVSMVAKLKKTTLHRGDIVVFYDGTADLVQLASALNGEQFSVCRFALQNANHVLTFHVLCDAALASALDSATISAKVAQDARALSSASAYAERSGATFYNVLEPTKYSAVETPDERLHDSYEVVTGTMRAAYAPFYAALGRLPNTYDLSHCLDSARQRTELYYDNYHVTDTANAIIARALYGALWRTF